MIFCSRAFLWSSHCQNFVHFALPKLASEAKRLHEFHRQPINTMSISSNNAVSYFNLYFIKMTENRLDFKIFLKNVFKSCD